MRLPTLLLSATLVTALTACGGGGGSAKSPTTTSSEVVVSGSSVASNSKLHLGTEVDAAAKNLMLSAGASALTIAIAKNGQIIYEQAYGYQDINQTIALKTDVLMRTASIVKPVTAAAIRKLDADGVLSLSDHVFCTGSNAPCWLPANLLSPSSDSRAKDITIYELIAHQGGWYRDVSNDPLMQEAEIRDALGLTTAPTREDITRYVMKRPLDFTPGSPDYAHDNYSNFGYMLLKMIVEQASHKDYISYVQTEIMAQIGVSASDFKAGQSRLADRDPREPVYISSEMCPSVFTVGKYALCSEEGTNLANGSGAISTARAMALFAQHYRLPANYQASYGVIGETMKSFVGYEGSHGGALFGLSSMVRQLPSGVSYAIFMNASANLEPYLPDADRISQLDP